MAFLSLLDLQLQLRGEIFSCRQKTVTEYFTGRRVYIDALTVAGDRELLESLMFDAEATRGAVSGWRKENFEDTPNGGPFRK